MSHDRTASEEPSVEEAPGRELSAARMVVQLGLTGLGLVLGALSSRDHVNADSRPYVLSLGVALATTGVTGVVKDLAPILEHWNKRLGAAARRAHVVGGVATTFAFFLAVAWLLWPRYPRYPLPQGEIATFTGARGIPVRTDLRNGFSVFSDSEFNLNSTCKYERIHVGGMDGHLRLHYALDGEGSTSYVGIFTGFSPPPEQRYSVKHFDGLNIRIRVGPAHAPDVRVVIALASANVDKWNDEYVWPEFDIPRQLLREEWTDVPIPFEDLRVSEKVPLPLRKKLDPGQVIQFVVMITTDVLETREGYIDLDDIRFE